MPRKPLRITCREDLLLADLCTLTIVAATPCFSERADPANIYVKNPDETGNDVYIGELADARLRALVCEAPEVSELIVFLRNTAVFDEDQDQKFIQLVDRLYDALNL